MDIINVAVSPGRLIRLREKTEWLVKGRTGGRSQPGPFNKVEAQKEYALKRAEESQSARAV